MRKTYEAEKENGQEKRRKSSVTNIGKIFIPLKMGKWLTLGISRVDIG